jgi:malonyl CoA-acyl carrier protein transacylase
MLSLRNLVIVILTAVVGVAAAIPARAQTASPPCSREQAIRVAVRACPGRPIAAMLERVRIREQNQSVWIVRVNNRNCRVVAGSMRRVSS